MPSILKAPCTFVGAACGPGDRRRPRCRASLRDGLARISRSENHQTSWRQLPPSSIPVRHCLRPLLAPSDGSIRQGLWKPSSVKSRDERPDRHAAHIRRRHPSSSRFAAAASQIARAAELPAAISTVAHEAIPSDPLDRRAAEIEAPEGRYRPAVRKKADVGGAFEVLACGAALSRGRPGCKLVPRTGRQTVVAAIDAIADQAGRNSSGSIGPLCSIVR